MEVDTNKNALSGIWWTIGASFLLIIVNLFAFLMIITPGQSGISKFFLGKIDPVLFLGVFAVDIATAKNEGNIDIFLSSLISMFEPLAFLVLCVWLFKKRSIVPAVMLFLLFLIISGSKFLLIAGLMVNQDPAISAKMSTPFVRQLFWTSVFGFAYYKGIRGAFHYRKPLPG